MNGFQLFLVFLGILAVIYLITVFYHMMRDKRQLKIQRKFVEAVEEVEDEQERKSKYLDGGNVELTEKEVKENDKRDEQQRRTLNKLRDVESRKRGTKKSNSSSSSEGGPEGRDNLQNDSFIKPSELSKESGRNNKKVKLSDSEEF